MTQGATQNYPGGMTQGAVDFTQGGMIYTRPPPPPPINERPAFKVDLDEIYNGLKFHENRFTGD